MRYWEKALSLVDGCTPVSEACDNCWLRSMNDRFKKYDFNKVTIRPDRLDIPLKTKKPTVFVVWSDLFHKDVPASFITQAFSVMGAARQHTFIVLTKRPERMESVLYGEEGGDYYPNIYLGTTVENQEQADKRVPELFEVESFKKILSIEPMLGEIDLFQCGAISSAFITERNIDGIILGGESGRNARPMHPNWVRSVRDQCAAAGVPFFFKQWGEWATHAPHSRGVFVQGNPRKMMYRVGLKKAGRRVEGREHNELAWDNKKLSRLFRGGSNAGLGPV